MEAKSLVVCAKRLRQKKEKLRNTRYHNSIYRFLFFFLPHLYILYPFFQRRRERKR